VETRDYFEKPHGELTVFVAEENGRVVGFLELDYRKYAPGCRSSPVPFIEGWYVESDFRRHGVGRALMQAAEARARAAGHDEIASDVEIENADGINAHVALGYQEVERCVSFRRSLSDA
jgi:aminoglycoside 6'-N-acetyltransferase I